MSDVIQIVTTFDNYKLAEKVGEEILSKKLCACYQIIGPIKSMYWWEGKIEKKDEWICFIKCEKGRFKDIEESIKSMHNYEIPEIISFNISEISESYLIWLNSVVKS